MIRKLASSSPLMGYIVVGGIGFLVDGGIMQALFSMFGWQVLFARAVSFPIAVTVTWLLNRNWTYRSERGVVSHRRYGLYMLTQIAGALVNFAVFAGLVRLSPVMADYPLLALAVAAVVAVALTYTVSTYVVFVMPKEEEWEGNRAD